MQIHTYLPQHFHALIKHTYKPASSINSANLPPQEQGDKAWEKYADFCCLLTEKFLIGESHK